MIPTFPGASVSMPTLTIPCGTVAPVLFGEIFVLTYADSKRTREDMTSIDSANKEVDER
jgi:hypothetical protein